MSSRELSEWMVYAQREPIGEQRADYRAALIAATIANANRGKGQRAHKVEDFLLFRDAETLEEPSPEGLLAKMRLATGRMDVSRADGDAG